MNTLTLLLTVLALAATAAAWHGLYLRPDGPVGVLLRRLAVDDRGEAGQADDDDTSDGDDPGDAQGDDQADDDTADEDALGDAGKKALDAMKQQRNAARREARDLKRRIAELEAKAPAEDPADADAIKAEARRDALAEANERILRSEVKAAAAGKLADPADALRLLDLSGFEVDDDGSVDEDEIADAIDELLRKKPYLAAQSGKRFAGNGDQGRKGPAPSIEQQIAQAESKGDWRTVISLQNQRLADAGRT